MENSNERIRNDTAISQADRAPHPRRDDQRGYGEWTTSCVCREGWLCRRGARSHHRRKIADGSSERILLIEDTSEIQMDQDNLVRFEARQPQDGLPAVSIRDLLKAALRHRPDRIILGEIRGGEAFDLLQLLNTGHSGSLSTVHATSAKQGLARFTSCVLQSGVDLPYRAIKTNIGDSLNVVVQLERRPGKRFVSEVVEINRYDPDLDEYDFGVIFQARQEEP